MDIDMDNSVSVPTLFIGVVSHEGSRFAESQGPDGLGAQLQARLPGTSLSVLTEDLWDSFGRAVTPEMVQATLSAELVVDRRWRAYLGAPRGGRWWGMHGLRWLRRIQRRMSPPSTSMVRRLLNIEMSHLALMRAGLASGATWVLILEDDAGSVDVADLAVGLSGLMAAGEPIAFANLSRSFSLEELGISHLLLSDSATAWAGPIARSVVPVQVPVTNTVCAIVYRADFLAVLVSAMEALPLEPVVPIDWKLNLALLALAGQGASIAPCVMVEPPPIDQLSMRSPEILPG